MWNFFCGHWKHQRHSNNRRSRDRLRVVLLVLVQFQLQKDRVWRAEDTESNWLSSIKWNIRNKQTKMQLEIPNVQTWNGSSQPGPAVIKARSHAGSFMWGPSHVPLSASRPKLFFYVDRQPLRQIISSATPSNHKVKLVMKSVVADNWFLLSLRCHSWSASAPLVLFGRQKDKSESNWGFATFQDYGPKKISDLLLLLGIYLPSAKITHLQLSRNDIRCQGLRRRCLNLILQIEQMHTDTATAERLKKNSGWMEKNSTFQTEEDGIREYWYQDFCF